MLWTADNVGLKWGNNKVVGYMMSSDSYNPNAKYVNAGCFVWVERYVYTHKDYDVGSLQARKYLPKNNYIIRLERSNLCFRNIVSHLIS